MIRPRQQSKLYAVSPRRRRALARRGIATLWMVIWLPCLLVLFCALVSVANLWLARVEAESAVEAAALAAAKEWGDQGGGDTLVPRQVGLAYAAANGVRGERVALDLGGDDRSSNVAAAPHSSGLIFGALLRVDTDGDPETPDELVFDAGAVPSPGASTFGVRVQANIPVQPLASSFLGKVELHRVQAKATAEYDPATRRVRLVRVDQFVNE